ncbi:MAG: hypothetical protein H0W04_08855 [Chthoniobacterales bacterium]|nr:hypothetical protein [Chthoniobacterales bacterium]
MKPTLHIVERKNRRDSVEVLRGTSLPKTDCNFHPGSFGDGSGRGGGKRCQSFRGISDEYFKTEARHYFAVEATIFGLIVLTAAVPVFEGIRGLTQFVWGIL